VGSVVTNVDFGQESEAATVGEVPDEGGFVD
jgi:hypothetical protein